MPSRSGTRSMPQGMNGIFFASAEAFERRTGVSSALLAASFFANQSACTFHAMNCDCSQFQPIELDRQSITRRIKQSPAIRKRLAQVAKHPDLRLYLFRCPDCGQLWQSGHGWNFANKEYLFQVPSIETADWLNEPYQQPADMMIYSAQMQDFWEKANLAPTDSQCRADGCTERAIRFIALCRLHHIESLQRMGQLPKGPVGRLFPPYYFEPAKET